MPFVKASEVVSPSRLKIGMYGPPGSGKSYTAQLLAEGLGKARSRRVAVVDTEGSHKYLRQHRPGDTVHPDPFDFDVLETRSLAEVLSEVRKLDPKVYGVVIIDSITHLWDAAKAAYEGRMTSIDTIPMQAWGKIKKPYKALIDFLLASNFDVIICGRQKNEWRENGGELEMVGVAMKSEGETPYEPDCLVRMECVRSRKDPTKSSFVMHVEKDRTSVLAGQHITNPDFKTFAPVLPLLGEVHVDPEAVIEAQEEAVARDGELLTEQSDKAKAKEEKSAGILADVTAKISVAQDLVALSAVGDEIKKLKRYILDNHLTVIRELYEHRRSELVNATTTKV